jgi:signal transduction histidine kinase
LALAHEVRNPLTNINLSVKLLESAIKDDELKSYLDIITRSSIRINNLIKEFLNQQLPDKILVEKESIQQLLDEVLDMTRDRIMLKNITVKKIYDAKEFKMLLDRQKIIIALTNIIINAIDSMDSKNGVLTISTSFRGGKYLLQIQDNGCGISKKNLEKIFDPYFTNKKGGLGLGLDTVSDILRSNHIELNVESKENNGTCFNFSFKIDPWHERLNALRGENAVIA